MDAIDLHLQDVWVSPNWPFFAKNVSGGDGGDSKTSVALLQTFIFHPKAANFHVPSWFTGSAPLRKSPATPKCAL